MWIMFQVFCISGFSSSEILSISSIQGWRNSPDFHWLTQSTLQSHLLRYLLSLPGWGSCLINSNPLPLHWYQTSSSGPWETISSMCIWACYHCSVFSTEKGSQSCPTWTSRDSLDPGITNSGPTMPAGQRTQARDPVPHWTLHHRAHQPSSHCAGRPKDIG